MRVYVLEGYFGDQEWLEGIYTSRKRARIELERLWVDRTTKAWPDDHYLQGHCKFIVYPLETK